MNDTHPTRSSTTRQRGARLLSWLILAILTSPASGAQNLLENPGFEEIPGPAPGAESVLPSDWIHLSSTPDTYSNDGSFGLPPESNGNFTGVEAAAGLRWVAAWSIGPEAFGQNLAAPLTPGANYRFHAELHQSFPSHPNPGGYCLHLATGPLIEGGLPQLETHAACCLPPTDAPGEWQPRECEFTAPAEGNLDAIVLVPSGQDAYPGIDELQLGAACGDGVVDDGLETCDDGNRLDGDCCSSECEFEAAGSECAGDADLCTAASCNGEGECVDGAPLACGPDLNPNDCIGAPTCIPATGACIAAPLPGFSRCQSDVDTCTLEFCNAFGACLVGQRLECDDGDVCNGSESCVEEPDPLGGAIPNLACASSPPPANGTACEADGISCTIDTCQQEACTHAVDHTACNDGFDCTADTCVVAAGGCVNEANDAVCDDSIDCTIDSCLPGEPESDVRGCLLQAADARCDDGSLCTVDQCVAELGCRYDNPCDDANLCTVDHCIANQAGDDVLCQNVAEPRVLCHQARGTLDLRDFPGGANDRVNWGWGSANADPVATAALGAPSPGDNVGSTLDFALCIWDHRVGAPKPLLWAQLDVPPGLRQAPEIPGGWAITAAGTKLRYHDAAGAHDGVKNISMLASVRPRKARAKLSAHGANLPFQQPPFSASQLLAQSPLVQVQLVNETGACWDTTFERAEVLRHDTHRFRSRN